MFSASSYEGVQRITPLSRTIRSPTGRMVFYVFLPVVSGVVLGGVAGLFGVKELYGSLIGFTIAILARGWPRLLVFGLVLVWIGTVFALLHPGYRGTHRWIEFAPGIRINIALPLLGLTFLTICYAKRKIWIAGIWVACFAGLALTKSFTLLFLLIVCTQFLPAAPWTSPAKRGHRIQIFALLVGLVLLNTNRRKRILEFITGHSYHSAQIRRVLHALYLTQSSPSAFQIHLPAAQTDLALLHLARTCGIAAVIAHLLCFAPLLFNRTRLPAATIHIQWFICISLGVQIAICLSIIPAAGMPAPFIGRGGTEWMVYSMLFGHLALASCTAKEGDLSNETSV